MKRTLTALALILAAVAGGWAELCGGLLPTVSWPVTARREVPLLRCAAESCPWLAADGAFHWFGWLCMLALAACGVYLLCRRAGSVRPSPQRERRWRRFRGMRRGYVSLLLLLGIVVLAALDQCLVGHRALAVKYNGGWCFPAFTRAVVPGSRFGVQGAAGLAEADYRKLKLAAERGLPGAPQCVVMPPVPFSPTMDAAPFPQEPLVFRDGLLHEPDGSTLYNGLACRFHPNGAMHLRQRFRNGRPDGFTQGWMPDGTDVYAARHRDGSLLEEHYSGAGEARDFLQATAPADFRRVHYHPAPPLTGGHLLGTNSQGADILAYLYGGLQVNIKAALLYLPLIYAVGLAMGMLMGYLGGRFDLFTQRVIEILSQLPFLFVVMVLADLVPAELRGLVLTLGLLAAFGWMQMTYLIRTATMREKTRDFVAAARTMGAGTFYIMRRHILPNLVSIIVTLVPFSTAAVILALASLDYMGFGLPETYASWGRLLNDGLGKLSCPWVVTSAFCALVAVLLLVTFIGEAVREACDPRQHTRYE